MEGEIYIDGIYMHTHTHTLREREREREREACSGIGLPPPQPSQHLGGRKIWFWFKSTSLPQKK